MDINEKIRGNYPEGWLSILEAVKFIRDTGQYLRYLRIMTSKQIGPDFLNDFRLEEQAECGGAMNLSKAMDYDQG